MINRLIDSLTTFTKAKLKLDISKRPYIAGVLISLIICLLTFVLFDIGTFEKLNFILSDVLMKSDANPEEADKNIVLLVVGQESLNRAEKIYKVGWPWRRVMYGKVSDYLRLCNSKVAAFDILFLESSLYNACKEFYDDDIKFAEAVKKLKFSYSVAFVEGKWDTNVPDDHSNNKVTPVSLSDVYRSAISVDLNNTSLKIPKFKKLNPSVDILTNAFYKLGLSNVISDSDNIFRTMQPVLMHNSFYYPTFPFVIAIDLLQWDKLKFEGGKLKTVNRTFSIPETSKIRLKFHGSNSSKNKAYKNYELIDTIILLDLLIDLFEKKYELPDINVPVTLEALFADNKLIDNILEKIKKEKDILKNYHLDEENIQLLKLVKPKEFKDKIVLIGGVAQGMYDRRPNPISNSDPGILLHATALDNILNNDFIIDINYPLFIFLLSLILSLIIGIIVTRFTFTKNIFIFLSFLSVIALTYVFLFIEFNILFDVITPTCSFILSFLINSYFSFLLDNRQKLFIKNAFCQYLSPKVIDQLLGDPSKLQLGGEMKEMTAMFSDLARFSSISENLTPSELVLLLNRYLSEMCDIITEYDGTVDKFEGDAIIAFWGAPIDIPNHALLAAKTSIKMQERISVLRQQLINDGLPPLTMRIGFNTGNMVVGNMGSRQRMNYTIMGDSVNLASRLEGVNKFYGTSILCSGKSYEQIKEQIVAREVDIIRVIGKQEAVKIYEVISEFTNVEKTILKIIDIHNEALNYYREKRWEEAINVFNRILEFNPEDNVTLTYIQRCKFYISNPPLNDWDGVFVMDSK